MRSRMAQFLLFLLSLYQLHATTHSEFLDASKFPLNAIADNEDDLNALLPPEIETQSDKALDLQDNEIDDDDIDAGNDNPDDDIPFVKSGHDHTELQFRLPISSVNIDYSKNKIILKFRKNHFKNRGKLNREEEEKRKALADNFMRFGRSPSQDFMRFGKRQVEELPSANSIDQGFYYQDPNERNERSHEVTRDSRGDNFMRFGRNSKDFMRFGRNPADYMRFGRSPADFMRLGRSPSDFMRLGRSPSDFMRLGRSSADFMRLGRKPEDFMRFGRAAEDFMRLGRNTANNKRYENGDNTNDFMRFGRSPGDFMRFGRTSKKIRREMDRNFMRFGRPDNFMRFGRSSTDLADKSANFMRFGKADQNFMRFGKNEKNSTQEEAQKNKVKQIMLVEHEKDSGESNPMDKAIKVLYNKQQKDSNEMEGGNMNKAHETDADYIFNMLEK